MFTTRCRLTSTVFILVILTLKGTAYSVADNLTSAAEGRGELGKKCRIYAASPYGFGESTKGFMTNRFYAAIAKAGCLVLDPWRHKLSPDPRLPELMALGKTNAGDIDQADGVVAALDGQDVDSGTAAEIGYAAAKGKWIIGYRGDFRKTGENPKVIVNLQVQYFITRNGGQIVTTLEEVTTAVHSRSPVK